MVFATGTERYKEEWNMKIIAKGEDGSLHPEDDFFLHVVSYLAVDHVDALADPYCK
jgi:hypothetical protein